MDHLTLTTREASERTGLSARQIRRLIEEGVLPATRGPRGYLIPADALGALDPAVVAMRREDARHRGGLCRLWWETIEAAAAIFCEQIAAAAPELPPRLVVAHAFLDTVGSFSMEYDRAVADALQELMTTPELGTQVLFEVYARHIRPDCAKAFAKRAGHDVPTLGDAAAADISLSLTSAWCEGLAHSHYRQRSADVFRGVAAHWGFEMRRVFPSPLSASAAIAAERRKVVASPRRWNS